MKKSPTQKSLKKLRDDGYLCAIVEHWNPFAKIRQDLFGFIDIVAIKDGVHGVFGIQTTSDSNISARMAKAKENPVLPLWLKCGNMFEVWGWGRRGARGKKKEWVLIKKSAMENE